MSIRDLIEAVEAGKARGLYGKLCDEAGLDAVDVMRADLHGDETSAFALMQAALPDWECYVCRDENGLWDAGVGKDEDGPWYEVWGAEKLAPALLLAILKAVEAQEERR